MNQKKALKEMWYSGYFRTYRKNKEINDKLLSDFEITSSNISMILKNCEFLRKTPKGWIQKGKPVVSGDVDIFYFEAGKPFTSRGNIEALLKGLKGHVKICDPYITRDTLETVKNISATEVKFLSSSRPDHLKVSTQELADFKKEFPHFEMKLFKHDHLHDRYIIYQDGLIIIGQGLSSKNKEGFVINLPKNISKDLVDSLHIIFDRRWNDQENQSY